MGADLCGYMLFGPTEIKGQDKIAAAIDRVKELAKEIDRIQALPDDAEIDRDAYPLLEEADNNQYA